MLSLPKSSARRRERRALIERTDLAPGVDHQGLGRSRAELGQEPWKARFDVKSEPQPLGEDPPGERLQGGVSGSEGVRGGCGYEVERVVHAGSIAPPDLEVALHFITQGEAGSQSAGGSPGGGESGRSGLATGIEGDLTPRNASLHSGVSHRYTQGSARPGAGFVRHIECGS